MMFALCTEGHLAAAQAPRIVERELDDAARALDGDRFDRDSGLVAQRAPVLTDPRQNSRASSEPTAYSMPAYRSSVVSDDHEIDVLAVARADAPVVLHGRTWP